ncbi:MAG: GDCCVxC domain-containing (seleno)protein [Candidatus Odinarchaeota archaeon]
MTEVKTESVFTCPQCGHTKRYEMPVDRCVIQLECNGCHAMITPKNGDCCVFCSYGDTPCPPEQLPGNDNRCC